MLRVFILSIFVLFVYSTISAQEHINFTDTFQIDELSVVSSLSGKYQVGVQQQSFSSQQLNSVGTGSLEEIISRYSPVYIRRDAGGLSTIRIRGTSPDHTSIMIGGLNINSLTLGHSNMSNIPVYLFDNISLQLGGSSAENGAGAIGGVLRLGLKEFWQKGTKLELMGLTGSFGEYSGGGKFFFSNGKFSTATRVYAYYIKNDFPFTSKVYDFEKQDYIKDKQRYATVNNKGILQEFNYRFNDQTTFKSFIWYEYDMHDAQPNMSANTDTELSREMQEDKQTRIWAELNKQFNKTSIKLGIGGVRDNGIYHSTEKDTIQTNRYIIEAEGNKIFETIGQFKFGVRFKDIIPNVYTYEDGLREQRFDAYLGYFKQFGHRTKLAINLRQAWVTGFESPFTPSIGVDYLLFSSPHSIVSLVSNANLSYKIPTFNDRYWGDQGNPNLLPEKGRNIEGGFKYTLCRDKAVLNLRSQYFYLDVDNWIIWLPSSKVNEDEEIVTTWYPENILRVISQGLELTSDFSYPLSKGWNMKSGLNYTYTSALRKEGSSTNKINQQIEYVPWHIGNAWTSFIKNNLSLTADGKFTGKRYYTEQEGDQLPGYFTLNTSASYRYQNLQGIVQIKNILNSQYQDWYYYAMPGISFHLTVKWNISKKA